MVVLTTETCWAMNEYWINNKISGIKLVFSLYATRLSYIRSILCMCIYTRQCVPSTHTVSFGLCYLCYISVPSVYCVVMLQDLQSKRRWPNDFSWRDCSEFQNCTGHSSKGERTAVFRNVGNYSPNYTASHPRRADSNIEWEPLIN